MSNSRDTIKVVCRLRPENATEKAGGYKICVSHTKESVKVNVNI